jgi:hypothetical protein
MGAGAALPPWLSAHIAASRTSGAGSAIAGEIALTIETKPSSATISAAIIIL